MVAQSRRKRLTLPVAPLAAAMAGGATSLTFALMPADMLGRLVLRSGIPAVIAAAEPPLGLTARLVLILGVGGLVALLGWFAVFLLVGSRTLSWGGDAVEGPAEDSVPVLRRADAHPDAPARRPLFANRDLGTPFLEVRAAGAATVEPIVAANDSEFRVAAAQPLPLKRAPIDLPHDLDLPIAAFDPLAMAAASTRSSTGKSPASAPVGERPQLFDPGERFETFPLMPPAPVDIAPPSTPRPRDPIETQATITALLERLERGVTDRNDRPPRRPESLEDTLGALRRMATRG